MGTVTTTDGTEIFYKDWGSGQPIVFSHGWPLSADDWDNQMLFFLKQGYRVIAHDRRGHGRSTQTGDGHDMDHYADDLAAVTAHLDLRDAIHVGHSTGGGEVVGVVVQVVPARGLRGPAMAPPVGRDHAVALGQEEQHLVVPVVRAQRPAVREHDGLALAPVLVEDLRTVLGRDGAHGSMSFQGLE